jgi:ribosomal protein L11 methyltransferase
VPTPPTSWTCFSLRVPTAAVDALSDLLVGHGSPGVVTGVRDLRRPGAGKRGPRTARVEAYFAGAIPLRALRRELDASLARLAREFPGVEPRSARLERLRDADYATAWRRHFPPTRIGRRFLVAPSWRPVRDPRRIVLRIDPGQAFGTGHHATTRSCLAAIEEAVAETAPRRGLDVGCGSGILALAMRALGVALVSAVDTDPLARDATVTAARENGLTNIRVLESLDAARGRFALVVANLFAPLLVELAPRLERRLAPGGTLIVSGILLRQEGDVRTALEHAGLACLARRALRGWVTLTTRRKTVRSRRSRSA